ncbi:MAG: urea ABC transporter permease subunit UrtB [Fibrobacteria bacterium]|nr:urea ABC transporter permease subunit UrtB [Fibrobacteria bacterium]
MRFLSSACSLLLALMFACPAQALVPEDLKAFAEGGPFERSELISTWASSQDTALTAFLDALEEGSLGAFPSGLLARTPDGEEFREWHTDTLIHEDPMTWEGIMVSNVLRAGVERARASQGLASSDPAVRREAVEALRSAASDPAMLEVVERARDRETDATTKALLQDLTRRLALSATDPERRIAAARALQQSGDASTNFKLLQGLLSTDESDDARETDPKVRAVFQSISTSLEARAAFFEFLGHIFAGISLGSILVLTALGLAITYGLLGVINMAHGELVMIGAYTTFLVQGIFRSWLPELEWMYVIAALPAAFAVSGLVGIALERLILRHLYGRPLESLLATWGASLILIQCVRSLFGPQNVEVSSPSWLSGAIELQTNLVLPWNRLAIIAFSAIVLICTGLVLSRSRFGLFVRATTQNRAMARCTGVRTDLVDMLAFGFGSGLAGLAGVALSQVGNVGPDLGQARIIDSFLVVVVGGVGQLAGALWAGLGLGMFSKILEPLSGAVMAKIALLVVIILFIQKRPQGLFALKGRQAE